jgi:hypothetical protein
MFGGLKNNTYICISLFPYTNGELCKKPGISPFGLEDIIKIK